MMKAKLKKLKGFTLVECLVAMAVLGIASLTIAQVYGAVALMNRDNHVNNTSLSEQMRYVERQTGAEAIHVPAENPALQVYPTGHEHAGEFVNEERPQLATTDSQIVVFKSGLDGTEYTVGADIYVLESKDVDGNTISDDDGRNLRFKYMIGVVTYYSEPLDGPGEEEEEV